MKKLTKLVVFTLIIAACNNSNKTETSVDTLEKAIISKPNVVLESDRKIYDCYIGMLKKDTVILKLTITDNSVVGNLAYNYFEKDRNKGTIKGFVTGDTLFAKYTFYSEGVKSVREVAFLTKNNSIHEGYGEQSEKNGETVFVNKAKLDFTKSINLKNTDCLN